MTHVTSPNRLLAAMLSQSKFSVDGRVAASMLLIPVVLTLIPL